MIVSCCFLVLATLYYKKTELSLPYQPKQSWKSTTQTEENTSHTPEANPCARTVERDLQNQVHHLMYTES